LPTAAARAPYEVASPQPRRSSSAHTACLERGAGEADRHVEVGAIAGEVLEELRTRGVEHVVGAFGLAVVRQRALALDRERGHGVVVADELDAPDRAVETGEEHVGHASSVAAASDIDSRDSDIAKPSSRQGLWRTSASDDDTIDPPSIDANRLAG
jgi:hypothetical protein